METSIWSRKLTEILYNSLQLHSNPAAKYEFSYTAIEQRSFLQWVVQEYIQAVNSYSNIIRLTNSQLPKDHFLLAIPIDDTILIKYLTERCVVIEKILNIKSKIKAIYEGSEWEVCSRKGAESNAIVKYPCNPKSPTHRNIALKYIYDKFVKTIDWRWDSFKSTPPKKILRDVVTKEYTTNNIFLPLSEIEGDQVWVELYRFVFTFKIVCIEYNGYFKDLT